MNTNSHEYQRGWIWERWEPMRMDANAGLEQQPKKGRPGIWSRRRKRSGPLWSPSITYRPKSFVNWNLTMRSPRSVIGGPLSFMENALSGVVGGQDLKSSS